MHDLLLGTRRDVHCDSARARPTASASRRTDLIMFGCLTRTDFGVRSEERLLGLLSLFRIADGFQCFEVYLSRVIQAVVRTY